MIHPLLFMGTNEQNASANRSKDDARRQLPDRVLGLRVTDAQPLVYLAALRFENGRLH
jgi:hypothetical protein